MTDSVQLDGIDFPQNDDEFIALLKAIDEDEISLNNVNDMFDIPKKALEEQRDIALAPIVKRRDEKRRIVLAYFLQEEKRLKKRRYKTKFTIGGTVFTVSILKRALVTTKEQEKRLVARFLTIRGLRKTNLRYVPELDRERVSSGSRLTRKIVAEEGAYIGKRQKTTIKTPSMRSALALEERHYPRDSD